MSAPEPAIDKATVDDLWAQFNNPLDDPYARPATTATTSSNPKQADDDNSDLVTIEVEYEFAGEKLKSVPLPVEFLSFGLSPKSD